MFHSDISPFKRLLGGVAIAALALTLAACSDEKKDASASAAPAETATSTDAKPVDGASSMMSSTAAMKPVDGAGSMMSSTSAMKPVDPSTTASTSAPATPAPAATSGTEMAQAAAPAAPPAAAVEMPQPDGEVDIAALMAPGPLPEMALGKADAPVTIVEYMSMTCPHCARFHNETFEPIKAKYVDSGKVRFVVREFPFDPRAAAAFMLARCAPEGQYFPMISVLFKQQEQWAAAQNGRDALLQMSKLAGFTQESFEACLTNQKLLDDVNATMQKGAKDFNVAATPTFFINGKKYSGEMSVATMSALIDSML